jgi:hypothetical protein
MPDGLSISGIAHMTGLQKMSVRRSLVSMPDVYIDRWERTSRRFVGTNPQWRAVYIAVPIPPDQPKPTNESAP